MHNAEEKDTSEHGNLANRGIFNSETSQNLRTKWIHRQEELNQLKL